MTKIELWFKRNKTLELTSKCDYLYSVSSILLCAVPKMWVFLVTGVSQMSKAYPFYFERFFGHNGFEIGLMFFSFLHSLDYNYTYLIIILKGQKCLRTVEVDVVLPLAKPHKPVSLFTLLSFVPFHCQDVSLRNLAVIQLLIFLFCGIRQPSKFLKL